MTGTKICTDSVRIKHYITPVWACALPEHNTKSNSLSDRLLKISAARREAGANQPAAAVPSHAASDGASGPSTVSKELTAAGGQSGPKGAAKDPVSGSLGIYPKSVDSLHPEIASKASETRRLASRRQLYADLKTTALILRDAMPWKVHGVAKCRWTKIAGQVTLNLMNVGGGQRRAAYKGIKVCGNIWGCPVCAARISQKRRAEMNTLLAWARKHSFIPVMLTLTARHGVEDKLGEMLEAMKAAKQRLRQRAEWRRLPVVGTVTATEITHGIRHGWHPHFHEIVLLQASSEAEALEMVAPLANAWRVSLRAFGLDGAAAAFDAQGAASAGDYVSKWGVAEEITLSGSKRGRTGKAGKGRSPRELVRLAGGGDDDARSLWLEFFSATSGKRRRQLVWTPRLKERCGLTEITDEEVAQAEDALQEEEVAEYDNDGWRAVRSKRVRLMEAAERGGSSAVRLAESGPDDADPEPSPEVIDCECDKPRNAQGNTSGDDFKNVHMSDPHCSVPKIRACNEGEYDDLTRSAGTPVVAVSGSFQDGQGLRRSKMKTELERRAALMRQMADDIGKGDSVAWMLKCADDITALEAELAAERAAAKEVADAPESAGDPARYQGPEVAQ